MSNGSIQSKASPVRCMCECVQNGITSDRDHTFHYPGTNTVQECTRLPSRNIDIISGESPMSVTVQSDFPANQSFTWWDSSCSVARTSKQTRNVEEYWKVTGKLQRTETNPFNSYSKPSNNSVCNVCKLHSYANTYSHTCEKDFIISMSHKQQHFAASSG